MRFLWIMIHQAFITHIVWYTENIDLSFIQSKNMESEADTDINCIGNICQ